MKLLIVGGSRFVGRHVVEAAVRAGHEVWLANRGRTTTDTFGAKGLLQIDRDGREGDGPDLDALVGIRVDAIIDVSAYVPRHVHQLHDAVFADGGGADRYLLVSTVSVYDPADLATVHDESASLTTPVLDTEEVTPETYGGLKVACEQAAQERWGDALSIVRPGIVAGPHDHTDRFTWWCRLLGEQDAPALPDLRDTEVQVIDARDLAEFMVRLLHEPPMIVDATGRPTTIERFVDQVALGLERRVSPRWGRVGDPESVPPLVLHPAAAQRGIFSRMSSRAHAHGLQARPIADTASDTHRWDHERGHPPLSV